MPVWEFHAPTDRLLLEIILLVAESEEILEVYFIEIVFNTCIVTIREVNWTASDFLFNSCYRSCAHGQSLLCL